MKPRRNWSKLDMKVQLLFLASTANLVYDLDLSEKLLRELRTSLAMKIVETSDLVKIHFQRPSERSIRAAAAIVWANRYAELSKNRILTEQAREDIKQMTLQLLPDSVYYFEHRRFRPGAPQVELDLGKFIWTLRDRVDLGEWLLYSWMHIISPLKHGGDPDRYSDPKKSLTKPKPALQMPIWTQVTEIVPVKKVERVVEQAKTLPTSSPPIVRAEPILSQESVVLLLEQAYQRSFGLTRQDLIKKLSEEERWIALEKALAAPLTLPTRFESKVPAVARQWYRAKKSRHLNVEELRAKVAEIIGIRS